MKKELKGFICGVLAAALCSSILVYGKSGYENIQVAYNNIKVYKDNVLCQLEDADGNTIEPFIYNGTTYLPLRGAATAADMDVTWDGDTKSVYLWDEEEPAVSAASADTQYSGTGYTITLSDDWVRQNIYEVNGCDLFLVNYTDSGNITVTTQYGDFFSADELLGMYLNHLGDSGHYTFYTPNWGYEEIDGRYYSEYYGAASNGYDTDYCLDCAVSANNIFYIFSYTTNSESTYNTMKDSIKTALPL
ncbi:MAG: copper amine oxidase N-terminal domain-containing protein [Clostridiales bacterium]|nr:copper amine oxidase N-terminal domain-containing protein [Clostridiales bacterium]